RSLTKLPVTSRPSISTHRVRSLSLLGPPMAICWMPRMRKGRWLMVNSPWLRIHNYESMRGSGRLLCPAVPPSRLFSPLVLRVGARFDLYESEGYARQFAVNQGAGQPFKPSNSHAD